jgi:hypothetical protein
MATMSPEEIVQNATSGYFEAFLVGQRRRQQMDDDARRRKQSESDYARHRTDVLQDRQEVRAWSESDYARKQADREAEKARDLAHADKRSDEYRAWYDKQNDKAAQRADERRVEERQWMTEKEIQKERRALKEATGYDGEIKSDADEQKAINFGAAELKRLIQDQEDAEKELSELATTPQNTKAVLQKVLNDPDLIGSGAMTPDRRATLLREIASSDPMGGWTNFIAKLDDTAKGQFTAAIKNASTSIGGELQGEAAAKYRSLMSRYNGTNIALQSYMGALKTGAPSAIPRAFRGSTGTDAPTPPWAGSPYRMESAVASSSNPAEFSFLGSRGVKVPGAPSPAPTDVPPPPIQAPPVQEPAPRTFQEGGLLGHAADYGYGFDPKYNAIPNYIQRGANVVLDANKKVADGMGRFFFGSGRQQPGQPSPEAPPTQAPAALQLQGMLNNAQRIYGSADPNEMKAVKDWWISASGMPRWQAEQMVEQDVQSAMAGDVEAQRRIRSAVEQFRTSRLTTPPTQLQTPAEPWQGRGAEIGPSLQPTVPYTPPYRSPNVIY